MAAHAFVTVFFDDEIDMIRMQARSMRIFLPDDLVSEIVFLDNCDPPTSPATTERILDELGHLREKCRIISAASIADVPVDADGWRAQQILKLKVAEHITADRYVVLDAKSHLVRPLDLQFLQSPDGRATANFYSFANHPLREMLVSVLKFFEVYDAQYIQRFTATVAPFIVNKEHAIACMLEIEKIKGEKFETAFVDSGLTEFFSYSAFLIRQGNSLDELYHDHQCFCPMIWQNATSPEQVDAAIEASKVGRAPFFAVHRLAFAQLERRQTQSLGAFWVECGLFDDEKSARFFVMDIQRKVAARRRSAAVSRTKSRAGRILRRLCRID